jgi:hypothetical protein
VLLPARPSPQKANVQPACCGKRTFSMRVGYFDPKRFVRILSARIDTQQSTVGTALRLSPHQKGRNQTVIILGGPLGRPFSWSQHCHSWFNEP